MSVESLVYAQLKAIGPTYPDIGPQSVQPPYITYQRITGVEHESLADGGGAPRVTIQVDFWTTTKDEAIALAESAKALLRAALPVGEIRDNPAPYEPDTKLHRTSFDVSIWA